MRVVVVGSGVAGASTAWALARAGAHVTVVDKGSRGQATAAGAGIIQPWSSAVAGPFYDLYAAGAEFYPVFARLLAEDGTADVGYAVTGSLVVDADPARLDEVEARVRARTGRGSAAGTTTRLSPGEARSLFPPLAPGLAGLHVSGGARVDGRRLRAGLLGAARRLGADIRDGEATLGTGAHGRPVVSVGGARVDGDLVVAAAGAWTNLLLAPMGVELPVEPQRGQLAHLFQPGAGTDGWPSVLPLARHYLVAFEEGRVVVGATRESGSGFDPRVTAGGLREVLDDALAVAPGLAGASLLETRVGLRPLATGPTGGPVIGAVPGHPGLFVNAGFGAAGLTMAPVVGHALAQQILTGTSELDLAPFAPAG